MCYMPAGIVLSRGAYTGQRVVEAACTRAGQVVIQGTHRTLKIRVQFTLRYSKTMLPCNGYMHCISIIYIAVQQLFYFEEQRLHRYTSIDHESMRGARRGPRPSRTAHSRRVDIVSEKVNVFGHE